MTATNGQVVYFARLGTCVKIGYATNLKKRIAALALPTSAVIATIPGGAALEDELHTRFKRSRIETSEWFTITPEIEEFIASIGGMLRALQPPGPAEPRMTRRDVPERLLHDITEASVLLDMTEQEVWKLVGDGKLEMLKIGTRPRFLRQQIDKLTRRQHPAA